MKVRYELSTDDLVEYAMTALERPAYVHAARMRQLGTVVVFGAMGAGLALLDGYGRMPAGVVVFGILFASILPSLWTAQHRRHVAARFSECRNRDLYAVQEMTLTTEAVIVRSEFKEATVRWRAFEEIRETKNLIVLEYSSVTGIVVPRRAFEDADACRQFMETARNHHARASSGILPGDAGPEGAVRM